MSRVKRFAHSLVSGYATLGANLAFTLASVPLALAYLPKQEFGLWALSAQAAGYMALIDLGMAGASRILIDHKDQRDGGDYGSVIQTLLWVSAAQCLIILAAGAGLAFGFPKALGVPPELQRSFAWLMTGQSALLAGTFLTRVFQYLLAAHQRYDVANYSLFASYGVNYALLWIGFATGHGVFSMLWGQFGSWLLASILCLAWCLRLRLFPSAGKWGRPSAARFVELFTYGKDIFLFFLGAQLVNASQTILVARVLGLEAAAVWSVCTRTFTLVTQLVYKLFDYSSAALAEMIVRRETERLLRRFRSLVVVSTSLGVVVAVLFAVCNQSFVYVWSGARVGWPALNDTLLACWLVICVVAHAHVGLVGQSKAFRMLPYIYFLEGAFFVAISLLVLRRGEVTLMLAASILASSLFTLPYGLWRTSRLFRIPLRTVVVDWSRPSLRVAVILVPLAVLVWFSTRGCAAQVQLVVASVVLGAAGAALLLRQGLEKSFQREVLERCPGWLKPRVARLLGPALVGAGPDR